MDRVQFLQDKMCNEVDCFYFYFILIIKIFAHGNSTTNSDESYFFSNLGTNIQNKLTNATQVLKSGSLYNSKQIEEMFQNLIGPGFK